jgi:membrane-associated phospholipid phosphatase
MLTRLTPWLPLPVLFATYQLAGWIARWLGRPSANDLLLAWDRRIFGTDPGIWLVHHLPVTVLNGIDLFYFSYYVLLMIAPWLMARRQGRAGLRDLWTSAGVTYFLCYLLLPWFPSTPPRLLFPGFAYGGGVHALNLWLLNHFSIGANVFPSAHVAAATCFALCHLRYHRTGWWFLAVAAGLAISTVSGGYHYGVDALAGAAVGVAGDRLGLRVYRRLASPGR